MSAEGAVCRWVLVAGATDGIGREAALRIAHTGAGVIVHGRNDDRGAQGVKEIRKATGNDYVEFLGTYMNERQERMDGHEMTFAVSCLAPFLRTNLLLPP